MAFASLNHAWMEQAGLCKYEQPMCLLISFQSSVTIVAIQMAIGSSMISFFRLEKDTGPGQDMGQDHLSTPYHR